MALSVLTFLIACQIAGFAHMHMCVFIFKNWCCILTIHGFRGISSICNCSLEFFLEISTFVGVRCQIVKNINVYFDFLTKKKQVDSMLGRRENPGEHEAMRKMKNEFMVNWDGLRTKDKERVLVLAATNRPFDLDEAVIRRFPRRYPS